MLCLNFCFRYKMDYTKFVISFVIIVSGSIASLGSPVIPDEHEQLPELHSNNKVKIEFTDVAVSDEC